MSRVGKKIIQVPTTVAITIKDQKISVKGNHGLLEQVFTNNIEMVLDQNQLMIKRLQDDKISRSYHGLMRALVQNMVKGVNEKFSKTLIAEGVGYKFQLEKETLIVNAGFTHLVNFLIPKDITITIESPTRITISGINKERVGFLASKIRDIRPPEPYKGKGILYNGEKIIRKVGKTGK